MSDVERKQRELYSKQQLLLREQRTADQERLLACISGGRPSPHFDFQSRFYNNNKKENVFI